MPKQLVVFPWLVFLLVACGPDEQLPPAPANSATPGTAWTRIVPQAHPPLAPDTSFIHTESRYVGPDGQTALLQNSFPKGGSYIEPGGEVGYTAPDGTRYSLGIFWTRVVNNGSRPLTLTVNFSADSVALGGGQGFYRLYLPTDTMTLAKRTQFNYGIRGLKTFLDDHWLHPTTVQRTLAAGEEHLFYAVLLLHAPDNGPIRTGLLAEADGALRYRVQVEPFGERVFSAGRMAFLAEL